MVIFRRRFRFLLGLIFLTIPAFVWSQPYLKRVCLQSNLDDIILYWDQASDPCGKFNNIAIFARPNTTTPFTQIGTVTNSNQTSFVHIGAASITDKWSYQLVYSFLCDDSEFKSDTLFLDFDQPDPSEIDSVSYDPVSGGFFIGWTANPAVDIHGYTLWDNENSNNFEFDNVYGALSYLDTRHDASAGPFAYIMTAFDSCGNQSVISRVHAAPFLSGSTSNCARKIDLSWTPYLGHANVSNEVYLSLDNGDYFRDTLLSGSTNSYSFNIESGQTVDAYVRINLNNGATSRSNPVRFKALDSFSLVSNYLSAVDWVAPNTFELRGTFDNPVTFDSLYIVELTESTPKYHWIDDIDENPYPLQIQVSSDTLSYYFQQILVDRCRRYYPSNLAYNTLLKGTESSVIDEYVLNWNLPRYFDGGLSEANLHLGEELPLYSTWNIYESELSDSFITTLVTEESLNIRCFQIQAIENDPNQFGFSETVHSNPKCFIQKPSIFFPNVVAVRGINNVFEPVGLSIDKKQSRIQIYTMNGQRIYDHDLTKAWTGLSEDGGPYHTTVFIYLADIYFLDGTRSQYSGNITVLY